MYVVLEHCHNCRAHHGLSTSLELRTYANGSNPITMIGRQSLRQGHNEDEYSKRAAAILS